MVNPPDSLVFTTTPPSPLLAGHCFLDTVEARRAGTPTPVATDTTVGLTVSLTPPQGARFYSDAACTSSITTTSIPAGASTASFYVKPLSGVMMTLTASAPFGSAMQSFTPRPVVRRGFCSFNDPVTTDAGTTYDLSVDCSVSSPSHIDLTKTVVVSQASAANNTAGALTVACYPQNSGTIRCIRDNGAADNTFITWQSVELPSGLAVQRPRSTCGASPITLTLSPAVNTDSTFVFKATTSTGSSLDDDDTSTVRLMSATQARIEHDGCDDYVTQFVELQGVTVTRGIVDAGFPAGADVVNLTNLPAASVNTAVLAQSWTAANTVSNSCSLLLQATMPTPTSLNLSRHPTCTADAIHQVVWERIDFGARATVQTLTPTMPAGTTQMDVPITPVDPTRTFAFSSAQIFGGQGNAIGLSTAEIDEFAIRLDTANPNFVRLRRGDADEPATLTLFVVQIEP